MKPPRFEYRAPSDVEEVVGILTEVGDEGKVLAGGQSLVPSMNFRLARPGLLVDINGVKALDYIQRSGDRILIGTLTRHSCLENAAAVPGPLGRLLATAAHHVGHMPIRVRGTFGGSVAHADPAAEWCMVSVLLDAEIIAVGSRGRRTIPAEDFFRTVFTTALEPYELLSEVILPVLPDSARFGFVEFSRRAGDFAIVASSVVIDVGSNGIINPRVALAGVGGTPVRARSAEAVLAGSAPSAELFRAAADAAAGDVEPMGDIHGSSEYRRHLVRVLTRRALERAASEA